MDTDGYPEEEELKRIKEWELETFVDFQDLAEYVHVRWYYPERWNQKGRTIKLSTGGWSGNESLVNALMSNTLFSVMCWQLSKRGGYHEFKLPPQDRKRSK